MPASSNANPDHRKRQQMHRKPVSNPTGSTPRSASVLDNATLSHIHDNKIVTHNTNTTNITSSASSLDLLYNSVATNAILNSGGRADEVRCHPGTREEVIGLVEKSIAQQYTGPQMLWLSGPAGAGKSAIMQTVAERCKNQDVPHANFFFFRADSSRKDARPFVATIMHQIIKRYPSVGAAVEATLTSDPLLFRMGVQQQVHDLLHNALSTMHDTLPSLPPIALLIDGLDECDSENKTEQRQLLQALDRLLIQKGLHFRVVIASRVEPQISMAFAQLCSQVNSIFLDEKYAPEEDIYRFVTAEFDKIKKTHYLAHTLGPEWPSASDVYGIVSKSSGQFIFAATVMRFIMYSPASPILSLQKVRGIVPPNKSSPFAYIDTVYAYILGQVEDLEAVKVLLSIRLVDSFTHNVIVDLMTVYRPRFTEAVFESCLSELAPLVHMKNFVVEFFHASFPDFLQDKTRSKEYYIDLDTFHSSAFVIWWRHKSGAITSPVLSTLKKIRQPTDEMTAALMDHQPPSTWSASFIDGIITSVRTLYVPKDLETFNQIMHMWVSRDPGIAQYIPQNRSEFTSQKKSSNFQIDQVNWQAHPSPSLAHSPTPQIRPAGSPMRPSRWQMRPSRPDIIASPIPQARSSTIQTRPHNPKTRPPSNPKTHPPTPNTHRSTPNAHPSMSQARSTGSKTRGFVRQVIPPVPKTDSVTPPKHLSTPKSCPSTSQAQPPSLQIPQSDHLIPQPTTKMLPSISQRRTVIARKKDDEASEDGIPGGKGKSVKRL